MHPNNHYIWLKKGDRYESKGQDSPPTPHEILPLNKYFLSFQKLIMDAKIYVH